jgi:GT2 family glycosyltransferase
MRNVSKKTKTESFNPNVRNSLTTLSRLRLSQSDDVRSQVSLNQAFTHYVALVRELGLLSGTKTMAISATQFLRDGIGVISIRRSKRDRIKYPMLRGAPREWHRSIEAIVEKVDEGKKFFSVPLTIQNLSALMARSGNDVNRAEVTIVIPAYNNFYEVAMCIESITSFASRTNYAIIVADDNSPDFNFTVLNVLSDVRVIRNKANLGYIKNVNNAAKNVETRFILTLNQDTVVCPGWLDELVAEMRRSEHNAIVGPRILNSSFDILEAGAFVYQGASASHRGRGSKADSPQFSFSCDIDYVSGCAMLVRTEVWRKLGGLNELLSPAYYDDVDLCLRTHALGMRVRYAPLSCIVHLEGTSMGKDPSDPNSLKRFQLINQTKVASAHSKQLAEHTTIDQPQSLTSHFTSGAQVVCVFDTMPDANRDGGSVDFELIVQYLRKLNYRVTALFIRPVHPEESITWRANGVYCENLNSQNGKDQLANADVVFSFGTMVGIRLAKEKLSGKRWIHHTSDVATRRLEAMNATLTNQQDVSAEASRWFIGMPRDVSKMWEIEKPTLEKPSVTLFVTEHDLQYAIDHAAVGEFLQFPILKGGPDSYAIPTPLNERTVGFVGSFLHSPNSDAVEYFLQDMWPSIIAQVPDSKFLIWGSGVKPHQEANWSLIPGVEVRGWFADWLEVVSQTRVLVSPLRFGAGMKHKVVSTLIYGRPVVGTRTSFEGFEDSLLTSEVMSDDANETIQSIVQILNSDESCSNALRIGIEGMGTQFSESRELERLSKLLTDTLATAPKVSE